MCIVSSGCCLALLCEIVSICFRYLFYVSHIYQRTMLFIGLLCVCVSRHSLSSVLTTLIFKNLLSDSHLFCSFYATSSPPVQHIQHCTSTPTLWDLTWDSGTQIEVLFLPFNAFVARRSDVIRHAYEPHLQKAVSVVHSVSRNRDCFMEYCFALITAITAQGIWSYFFSACWNETSQKSQERCLSQGW